MCSQSKIVKRIPKALRAGSFNCQLDGASATKSKKPPVSRTPGTSLFQPFQVGGAGSLSTHTQRDHPWFHMQHGHSHMAAICSDWASAAELCCFLFNLLRTEWYTHGNNAGGIRITMRRMWEKLAICSPPEWYRSSEAWHHPRMAQNITLLGSFSDESSLKSKTTATEVERHWQETGWVRERERKRAKPTVGPCRTETAAQVHPRRALAPHNFAGKNTEEVRSDLPTLCSD